MAVPSSTLQTFTQTNIREDLSNLVFNVDPYETPLVSMAKRAKAEQTHHEWNIDALDAQNLSNAQVQGDDAANDAVNVSGRLGNQTQISRKVVGIARTAQSVRAAGGTNKMGYQLLKKAKGLKIDMEGILTANAAQSAGSSSVAGITAGLPSYLVTNTAFQTGGTPSGANPSGVVTVASKTFGNGTSTRTDNSVLAAVSETSLRSVLALCKKNSGRVPDYALVSVTNKQIISTFTGPSGTLFRRVEDKTLRTAIDEYESDFGTVRFVPDIYLARSKDIFGIAKQYIGIAYLDQFKTVPLAKTGDADRKMLIVEYALEVRNEHAHFGIFDTTG